MKLTEEQKNMIVWSWQDTEDITTCSQWDNIKEQVAIDYPALLSQFNIYKNSEHIINLLIKDMENR